MDNGEWIMWCMLLCPSSVLPGVLRCPRKRQIEKVEIIETLESIEIKDMSVLPGVLRCPRKR
jgi:hypothetical protein